MHAGIVAAAPRPDGKAFGLSSVSGAVLEERGRGLFITYNQKKVRKVKIMVFNFLNYSQFCVERPLSWETNPRHI